MNFKQRSFTLIELLVVIAIIGVLASIVLVSLSGAKDQAELAKAQSFARQVRTSLGLSLVGEWKFDDEVGTTTRDNSGLGNDGILGNGLCTPGNGFCPTWTNGGIFGKALIFDGDNDYVAVADNDSSNFGIDDFSISLWIKANTNQCTYPVIYSKKQDGDNRNILFLTSGQITFMYKDNGVWWRQGGPSLKDDTWHHIVVSADRSSKTKIYVDSNIVVDENSYIGDIDNTGPTHIGCESVDQNNFNGIIDEVQIYNEALSLSQIQQLYAQGAVKYNIVLK